MEKEREDVGKRKGGLLERGGGGVQRGIEVAGKRKATGTGKRRGD